MPLSPGDKLGQFDVLSLLGKGGMGEVYRARDTQLKREVALKVLPGAFANDPDRLARFQREAEVLASLNHPNIAAIYGVVQSGGAYALVMELVIGESPKGPMPWEDAWKFAQQMASALEYAHDKNIVHRDLKPANVMVTADGVLKLLDFGLAKAMSAQMSGSLDPENSPTLTMGATVAGTIMGTAGYMAPEQAKGKQVDKRADIWAFGVVLWELLIGERLFKGEDVADTLAQVLTKEVDVARAPIQARRLLTECLKKDPKLRLRDIGDAPRLIGEVPVPSQPVSSTGRWVPWAVATSLALALAIALWSSWRTTLPEDRPLVRLDVDLGADVSLPSTAAGSGSSIAISPDGIRLVYVSGTPTKLFTRRLDQAKATELPGTAGASRPFFSPDGQWVGFLANGKVHKISVEGGAVVQLMGELTGFGGAGWAEDGSIFVSDSFGRGLLQLPAAGGSSKIAAPLGNSEAALALPSVLPGGKAILFSASTAVNVDTNNIEVLTLADGRRKILARGGQSPHYLPSANGMGHLVYINKATLFAIPFNANTLETSGTAVPVLDDVAFSDPTGTGQFEVSRTGTFIYRRSSSNTAATTTVQWAYPTDGSTPKKEPLRAKPGYYRYPSLAPDGKRIALTIPEGGSQDIWVYDPQRDALTRLTFGGFNRYPVWSPDGQYVVFTKANGGVFQARADGASQPQALTVSKANQIPWSFTPDGKRLAYMETPVNQIWTVPLEDQGGQLKAGKPEQFLKSNFLDQFPSFSPDGRWLAYESNESGKNEIYIRAFPLASSGQGGKWQVSNSGGTRPRWSRAGHELVFQSGDQLMTAGYTVKGDIFVAERPRVWIAKLGGTDWDLAPDAKRVVVVTPEESATAPQQEHVIVMLQNFADELRRKVPLGK